MIKKITMFLMAALAVVITSCKNDKEEMIDVPTGQDYSGVVLNEVCGQSDDGDWIEFYNNSDKDVQLDGCVINKTDEKGNTDALYTFPSGSTIKAKGYLVVYGKESKAPQFDKGISNTKQIGIELLTPGGKSIDKFDRDANVGKDQGHENNGSYARIPNGDKNGKWVVAAKATPGAANEETTAPQENDYSTVVLNEICGQSDLGDWIELYNNGDKDVQLDGCVISKTDEKGKTDELYTFPAGSTIKAKSYLIIYGQDSKDPQLKKGVSNTKQVIIELLTADGKSIDKFDRDSNVGKDQGHDNNGSYARIPNGDKSGKWVVVKAATPNAENKEDAAVEPSSDMKGVVLNEICGLSDADDTDDWIEIFNNNNYPVKLDGAKIVKDGKNDIYTFAAGKVIEAGGYIVLSTKANELTKNISNKKEVAIDLQNSEGKSVDKFDRDENVGKDTAHDVGQSYSRVPNGTGKWKVATATRGKQNPDK